MSQTHSPSNIAQIIGAYLRSMRIEKNLTGGQIGELLSISQQQVSRYERGINRVSLEFLMSYVEALDLSFDDFLSTFLWELQRERLHQLNREKIAHQTAHAEGIPTKCDNALYR